MKVYKPDPLLCAYDHYLPIHMENEKWEIVDSVPDSEIIVVSLKWKQEEITDQLNYIRPFYNNQLVVVLSLWHVDAFQTNELEQLVLDKWGTLTDNVIIVNTNIVTKNVFYDFLWDRQKLYFIDLDNVSIELTDRVWTHWTDIKMLKGFFVLPPITKKSNTKKFLAPNRVFDDSQLRTRYRVRLREFLKTYANDGYLSLRENMLRPEGKSQDDGGNTFVPVANDYYNDSYISIYTETLMEGPVRSITEKTWSPLIKGHFILPFGYCGLVQDIKSYGFVFPNWIDYSYDAIADDDLRFQNYLNVVKTIVEMPNQDLERLHNSDLNILIHNRNIFYTNPYDSLYQKIKNAKETR